MELDDAYGAVLRAARKRKGLSQEDLASEAGVERNYISMLERGRNSPTLRMQYKLAAALGQSPLAMLAHVEELIQGSQKKR